MALIKTTRRGRTIYIVRWNYRSRSIDGQPFDKREFSKLAPARAWNRKVSGTTLPGERATINDVYNAWLADGESSWAQWTYRGYKSTGQVHIIPGLGKHRTDKLTSQLVNEWLKRLRANDVSEATCNKALRTLRAMLKWARGTGITTCQAANDVKGYRKSSPTPPVAYSTQQITQLAQACSLLRDSTAITVGAYTGLRRSELFALHWSDIDLAKRTLRVNRALDLDRSYKKPKSYEARTVLIIKPGVEALERWAEHGSTGLVFPGVDARPVNQRNWDRDILGRATTAPAERVTKKGRVVKVKAGIRIATGIDLQMHQLRDTYASLLLAAKLTIPQVQESMGHEDITTTLKHYAVWLPASRDEALDDLDALVASGTV